MTTKADPLFIGDRLADDEDEARSRDLAPHAALSSKLSRIVSDALASRCATFGRGEIEQAADAVVSALIEHGVRL